MGRPNWDLEDFLTQKLGLKDLEKFENKEFVSYMGMYCLPTLNEYQFSTEILREEYGIKTRIEVKLIPLAESRMCFKIIIFKTRCD